ncbi:Hypothetical protein PYTT_1251 [Akkermansia glycaniphila]|uniref:Uncharacterized protein n=1 Tax=Akkermansia glycaniphila TaxID=1679444 RepID=A0A1H6LBP4_9BACT|nr:Hypothetical protein PYTT_1251 [Akkermansia glycaniphila]
MDKYCREYGVDRTTVLRVSLRSCLQQLDAQGGNIMPEYHLTQAPEDLFAAEKQASQRKIEE